MCIDYVFFNIKKSIVYAHFNNKNIIGEIINF